MKYKKVYVEMIADMKPDGVVRPMTMIWDDGRNYRKYEIDKVKEIRRGASMKAGGLGLRYLVMIKGQQKILWLEDDNKWFVEVPENLYVAKDEM